jgi:hypothetical protein
MATILLIRVKKYAKPKRARNISKARIKGLVSTAQK